ncbi:hypothetical protein [Methylovulum psychrotolerans]|uniref:Uncharacterized protein n=1 Tax=Methylovulum psychrotolerans TaxID=1704499 RepID=A0A1Z4C3N6_9GAMM|nr:hypothetical protein [Methylovulum psychrotolerans]ASF48120.1 hypothetical protein CEK71_19760 [Methylovulum psychrotolerans]
MANDYKSLLREGRVIVEDLAKACSEDEIYYASAAKLLNHYENSKQTDEDKKEFVADGSYLFYSWKANVMAQEEARFKHLPKVIFAGRGAIKALTDVAYETLIHTIHHESTKVKMRDFVDNVRYHYVDEFHRVADPVRNVWRAVHEILEEHRFGFHSEY